MNWSSDPGARGTGVGRAEAVRRVCIVCLATVQAAMAAPGGEPHIGYIYPAGARQGATLEVVIGGQSLDGVDGAQIYGGGVSCRILRHLKTLTPGQMNMLRTEMETLTALEAAAATNAPAAKEQAQELRDRIWITLKKAGIEELSLRALGEYRRKNSDPKRQVNPALTETVHARLTLASDATPGRRDVRLRTAAGLTNPMAFRVGLWPEYCEKEPNDRVADRGLDSPLPVVVNGQILPGDVDRIQFTAGEGDRLVAAVSARSLIPYLADAVPGWFQATLRLRDDQGKELAYADDFRFSPDPVLCFDIPRDGTYVVEIGDALFRGREDFVYRIALGAFPFVTGVFPPGGRTGECVAVALEGWNLGEKRAMVDLSRCEPGLVPAAVPQANEELDGLPFVADEMAGTREQEPNDAPDGAQRIAPPCVVDGRIERAGDVDVYRFAGRAGDPLVAEVFARRLGTPVDSVLSLAGPAGERVAVNDDYEDRGCGLTTHHADSRIQATLKGSGVYTLRVADSQQKGGSAYTYRLRVGPPRPDFALRVAPSAVNIQVGATAAFTVFALRKDGFEGDIALALKDAPRGCLLGGAWVPAGQDRARVTLSVPALKPGEPVALTLEGRAVIGGREAVRRAVPAEDMMQAFFYRHLVPAQGDWMATAAVRAGRRRPALLFTREPLLLPAGGTAVVRYGLPPMAPTNGLEVTLSDPPAGIRVAKATPGRGSLDIVLTCDGGTNNVPTRGNLFFEVSAERIPRAVDGKPPPQGKPRIPLGLLPAVRFERAAVQPQP